jgi:ArsR family transcriptional regulator
MNMRTRPTEKKVSKLLQTLGQPARLQILLAIGEGEACVCHLEAVLGLRQAYISQHLMVLRKAKVLQTRREGRFIFYRLRDLKTLELIRLAAKVASVAEPIQLLKIEKSMPADCVCPSCAPAVG